jgi:hypothetical protein
MPLRCYTSPQRYLEGLAAAIVFLLDLVEIEIDIRISWYWASLKNNHTAQGAQIPMSRVDFRRAITPSR